MELKYRIERQILIGMIVSDEFNKQILPIWNEKVMKTDLGKRISRWCVDYYTTYGEAPRKNLETLYIDKLRNEKLDDETAEDIEDLLDDLSDEFDRDQLNVQYLIDKAKPYFLERNLEEHQEEIQRLLDAGQVGEANKLALEYAPPKEENTSTVDLSNKEQLDTEIEYAFAEAADPLFKYPGPIGDLLNEFMVRDAFVAFMAQEKGGKSMQLLDLAMRAAKYGCNVAFFQAGDMSKSQQLMRISINRSRKNNKEKYTGKQWIPVKDCIHNQLDTCTLPERECGFGIFDDDEIESRKDITRDMIIKKSENNPTYSPCSNCLQYRQNRYGSPWLVKKDLGTPLTEGEAKKVLNKFFVDKKRRFKLATYPNKTLTVKEIESQLNQWEKEEGFIADVIVVDYADILVSHVKEFRHGQDDIWANLRGLSQKKHALLATVTQAKATSYKKSLLSNDDFSEDKRKLGHVTAMFGINKDPKGKLAELKQAIINKIVIREGAADPNEQVTLLQSLEQSNPILSSYF